MPERAELDMAALDRLMVEVIRENPEQVMGWMTDKPGSWGFLAGRGVLACRDHLGRSLSDLERRRVWDRLWRLLERLKERIAG